MGTVNKPVKPSLDNKVQSVYLAIKQILNLGAEDLAIEKHGNALCSMAQWDCGFRGIIISTVINVYYSSLQH